MARSSSDASPRLPAIATPAASTNSRPAKSIVAALPAEQRRDGERRSAGRRPNEIAQHRSTAARQRVFAALGQDPHRAAADETGVPGQLFGQLVRAERPAALAQHLAGGKNRVGFDTPAAERPGGPLRLVICHDQLGADHLGRAAQGADHGGEREAFPGLFELGHPGVKGGHENKCKRPAGCGRNKVEASNANTHVLVIWALTVRFPRVRSCGRPKRRRNRPLWTAPSRPPAALEALKRHPAFVWKGEAQVHVQGKDLKIVGTWSIDPPDKAIVETRQEGQAPEESRTLVINGRQGYSLVNNVRSQLPAGDTRKRAR